VAAQLVAPTERAIFCRALPLTPPRTFLKKGSWNSKNFWKWVWCTLRRTMSLLSHRYVGALCLFPHRLGDFVAFQVKQRRASLVQARLARHYFPCLSFGQGRWGSEFCKRGRGRRLDDPSKRQSQPPFEAQTKRLARTMTTFPFGEGGPRSGG